VNIYDQIHMLSYVYLDMNLEMHSVTPNFKAGYEFNKLSTVFVKP